MSDQYKKSLEQYDRDLRSYERRVSEWEVTSKKAVQNGYQAPEAPVPPIPPAAPLAAHRKPRVSRYFSIACVSDTHEMHDKVTLPSADLVIHAGDMTGIGEYHALVSFDIWGRKTGKSKKRLVCIAGNHDKTFQSDPELARSALGSWTYLEDSEYEVSGLKIWGTPWSPDFFPDQWAFNQNPRTARARWETIPEDTDILIVHGPPYGIGDLLENGNHVGCPALLERITQIRPKLVVCGHIHEGYGTYTTDFGTLVVNAATCTGRYKPTNPPILVHLPLP